MASAWGDRVLGLVKGADGKPKSQAHLICRLEKNHTQKINSLASFHPRDPQKSQLNGLHL